MSARFDYIIAGGGLAAASAVQGIRERDGKGSVLMISAEGNRPYHRPPLSKQLWTGKKAREQVFVHDPNFYTDHGTELVLGARVAQIDPADKTVRDTRGGVHEFGKLLLATGGVPRTLSIPGGDSPGIVYFRTLEDYDRTRSMAKPGKRAVVIGGGFIGSELAAALNMNNVDVTMVFPGPFPCSRIFPSNLGHAMQRLYEQRGVRIIHDTPSAVSQSSAGVKTHTEGGETIDCDFVIAGIGIAPAVELARNAGLSVEDGIVVDEYLCTSHPDIYAAGDNAQFPYQALGRSMRVEHWDNARAQGQLAGSNMAGAGQSYSYMPYFFSDLFEFGYEAVGEVSSSLQTVVDWKIENEVGVIYYLRDARLKGVMMCNVWGKVDAARELIRAGNTVRSEELRGKIPFD